LDDEQESGTAQPLKFIGIKMNHDEASISKLFSLSEQYEDEFYKLLEQLNLTEQ
jgi:hypothetical protein